MIGNYWHLIIVYIKYKGELKMANKNRAGNSFNNWKKYETKIVDRIDKREKNGKNMENVDDVYNNYKLAPNGARVWSV